MNQQSPQPSDPENSRKMSTGVKVALIGAISTIVVAIITYILAPIVINTFTHNPTPTPSTLPAPVQVSPPNGAVFNNYPRTTILVWNSVPEAISYSVQIYFYDAGNTTCTGGTLWDTATGLTNTRYIFDFAGAQPGCWRVWAIDDSGHAGAKSPLWEFSYTV